MPSYDISNNDAITSIEAFADVVTLSSSAACNTTFCSPPIGTSVEPVKMGAFEMSE
jgi:hypothetical protein